MRKTFGVADACKHFMPSLRPLDYAARFENTEDVGKCCFGYTPTASAISCID
jgi:hypothetical protein